MFSKTGISLLLASFFVAANSNQRSDLVSKGNRHLIAVNGEDFLKQDADSSDFEGKEEELINATGTYPCVFKLG